ncbi:peptidylprolyl isomerase [Alteromonas sp. 14N.309.X.WAT.G.H12]|uniref:peptidylprolyl isomerase n=1 Tax=Alteromonas sp. 14N.309.X.WAT.G.H12 TaxID=3120824 RepID=UPI002FD4B8AD
MIQVNQTTISEQAVMAEVQYHPASTKRAATLKAAESLIIGELLRQRANALELVTSTNPAEEERILDELIAREVAIPTATEKECEQYYKQNPKRFESSPLLEISHILLAASPDDDNARVEAKARSEIIIEQLQQGERFADLARRYSACPSKETDGNLGQISRGQTVAEFERQIFNAQPGLMPQGIESRYGIHVVYIHRKIEGQTLPFNAVKQRISDYLNEKVRRKALAQYIHQLIIEAEIHGYDFNLSDSPLMQ